MRWTKIKNIVLLLLVVVNLFLLGLVGVRAWRTAQNDRLAQARMLQILENNGIAFLPAAFPGPMDLTGRRLTLTPVDETRAAALVGEITAAETMGTRTIYRGERGVLTVTSSGEVTVDFFDRSSLTEEQVWQSLEQLGLSCRETARRQDGGMVEVEACLLLEGAPLPGEVVTLTSNGDVPANLSFRALLGSSESLPSSRESISAATALLRLLDALNRQGYICSRIDDLYAGYTLSGAGPYTLEPTWFVEIDTAPWRLAIDAYTGAVTTD
ncbi:MAG: hypothetical protein K2F83_01165 [Oscillospiraceae bacterium]|nr:hypothetical protein [Oscillospiraceae bacterium]